MSDWTVFRAELSERLTVEQAEFVRCCRAKDGETQRGVAERFCDRFGDDLVTADLRGNQIVGMFLIEIAAERLGESAETWDEGAA